MYINGLPFMCLFYALSSKKVKKVIEMSIMLVGIYSPLKYGKQKPEACVIIV